LGGAVDELDRAKTDGVDAVLDLSRARAISSSMAGDQSRYLLDQENATTYQQVYFDKAQSVLYRPAPNLREYTAELAQIDPAADSLGLLGGSGMQEIRGLFADFQQSDGQLRDLARGGQTEAAIAVRLGDSATDFATVDGALVTMIDEHRTKFSTSIDAGERAIGGWGTGSAIVALLAIGLIVVGVRPRLTEYR
jgi:hypothetical protein